MEKIKKVRNLFAMLAVALGLILAKEVLNRSRSMRRFFGSLMAAGLLILLSPGVAPAPTFVTIGNGADQPDGTYLNAQNIADNLVFTSITVQVDNNINIEDNIDLSTSIYGTPAYDLSLVAPILNMSHNMNLSVFGNLVLTVNTLNLDGKITSGGDLIDPARVLSTSAQLNVLSNNASIQQAIALA